MLAPAFASLLALYESCLGRQIRVGGPDPRFVSADEQQLLGLLERAGGSEARLSEVAAKSRLSGEMRVAVRSTRLLLRRTFGVVGGAARPQRRPTDVRPDAPRPRADTSRRNRSPSALVDALRVAYPVTAKILGKAGFEAAARAFARRNAPDGTVDAGYGRGFAPFLAEQLQITDQLYLADVASLERLRTEAETRRGRAGSRSKGARPFRRDWTGEPAPQAASGGGACVADVAGGDDLAGASAWRRYAPVRLARRGRARHPP